ncbi:hypothetical protein ACWDUM_01985 [Rhodococcus sp. NPDC003322]
MSTTSEALNERVEWALEGRVARITLIRESGNALDMAAAQAIREAAGRIARGADEGTVRVAVIGARGATFCVEPRPGRPTGRRGEDRRGAVQR